MGNKGTFDLPRTPSQSTRGARNAYRAIWGRDWPHDDDYLRILANEVDQKNPQGSGKRCDHLLMRMRENHVFEESA
jgi:hypothetical protein